MSHKQQLAEAIAAFNDAERAEFIASTGLTWLGLDGPVYVIGDARAKALFVGRDGRHWADGALFVESIGGLVNNPALLEGYRQAISCADDVEDLWVYTDARGRWNALVAPVDSIARACGYPEPFRMPDGDWARTWWDAPARTDEAELAWIAHGGTPLHDYVLRRQL